MFWGLVSQVQALKLGISYGVKIFTLQVEAQSCDSSCLWIALGGVYGEIVSPTHFNVSSNV